jgi:hypothetical protein
MSYMSQQHAKGLKGEHDPGLLQRGLVKLLLDKTNPS